MSFRYIPLCTIRCGIVLLAHVSDYFSKENGRHPSLRHIRDGVHLSNTRKSGIVKQIFVYPRHHIGVIFYDSTRHHALDTETHPAQ